MESMNLEKEVKSIKAKLSKIDKYLAPRKVGLIIKKSNQIGRTELIRKCQDLGADLLDDCLKELIKSGHVKQFKIETGSRRADQYKWTGKLEKEVENLIGL